MSEYTLNSYDESTISQDVSPCPNCGSRKREVAIAIQEKVKIREKFKAKTKKKGIKKPIFEVENGDDLHIKSGKWYAKERIIDRENNRYKEIVNNPETGEIVHYCEEPLKKHIGHGSAKVKIPKEKGGRKQKASEDSPIRRLLSPLDKRVGVVR